jgi:hypothetical protein
LFEEAFNATCSAVKASILNPTSSETSVNSTPHMHFFPIHPQEVVILPIHIIIIFLSSCSMTEFTFSENF